jgi:hypothetical protein
MEQMSKRILCSDGRAAGGNVLTFDAPMYRAATVCRAQGQCYLNLASCARDAMYRRVPSRKGAAWNEDELWFAQ